ncbi:MAG: sigma 54-interacting transcriptional regulator [Gemmatimonadales bacterium]
MRSSGLREEGAFHQVVGESRARTVILRELERVAPTDTMVLLCGETGTGEELLARAVQNVVERACVLADGPVSAGHREDAPSEQGVASDRPSDIQAGADRCRLAVQGSLTEGVTSVGAGRRRARAADKREVGSSTLPRPNRKTADSYRLSDGSNGIPPGALRSGGLFF